MEGEQLIGGVASNFLRRERWSYPGYGIYATNERLIGIKMRKGILARTLLYGLGSGLNAYRKGEAIAQRESDKTLQELEQKKDFEIGRDQISRIEIKKPGTLKAGCLRITAKSGSDIEIIGGNKKDFEPLRDLMKAFFPDALKVQE